jgi:flagellin
VRTEFVGAAMNRLESAIRNMESSVTQTESVESRIRDADMAAETAELAKNQILQQSSVAVLGQANSLQQTATRLLR